MPDLFEVVLTGEYYGQEIVNRFNYVGSGTPAAVTLSFGLISALGAVQDAIDHSFPDETLMRRIHDLCNGAYVFKSIIAKNIYVLSDFYSLPFYAGTTGHGGTGDNASPALAYGIHSNQVTRAVRAGSKRFSGVDEAWMGDGGTVAPAALTVMDEICSILNSPITYIDESATLTYSLIVISKETYTDGEGKKHTRYYTDKTVQIDDHGALLPLWTSQPQIRTQTSRQYGRGA